MAPREPQEVPGGLPDPQKTMKNAILSTNFGFSAESDFGAAQRAPRAARERPGGRPVAAKSAPGRPKRGPRAAKSGPGGGPRGGPGQDNRGHDKRRPQKTKTREAKTREDQSDRSQHKIRQDKTRGRTTRGDQRGEVYAPKRRCFPTRFHKRTKRLSDPRRPRPLEPSTTDFSCI